MDVGSDVRVSVHRFAVAVALLVIAFWETVLAGRIFDVAALEVQVPGRMPTNVKVVLCLVLIGVALAVRRRTSLSSAAPSGASVRWRWPFRRRHRLRCWARL